MEEADSVLYRCDHQNFRSSRNQFSFSLMTSLEEVPPGGAVLLEWIIFCYFGAWSVKLAQMTYNELYVERLCVEDRALMASNQQGIHLGMIPKS